ncbi:MAG TPA: hypothetical protein DHV08_07765 [Rhodocyclaceae bacterium]|nr:hypothetical protein [Rhodocyclaceae bacterium]
MMVERRTMPRSKEIDLGCQENRRSTIATMTQRRNAGPVSVWLGIASPGNAVTRVDLVLDQQDRAIGTGDFEIDGAAMTLTAMRRLNLDIRDLKFRTPVDRVQE